MKAVGLIVEYNPFHNGHKYHLEKAKEISQAEVSIACMSGNFLQRGEPALLNKWTRAKMALNNGVDLVVELPSFYSNQAAQFFAHGAISMLNNLKADSIVFGSECGEIELLENIVDYTEEEDFSNKIKELLKNGKSYPNAMNELITLKFEEGSLHPNNILGIEYIRAIKKLKSPIKALTIKREKVAYYDQNINDKIASATGIREFIKNGDFESIKTVVPPETYEILMENCDKFAYLDDYFLLIKYRVIADKNNLSEICDMEQGLWNRVYESVKNSNNLEGFMEKFVNRRYTLSRTKRILTHILLNIENDERKQTQKEVPFIRVLAFNNKGAKYLKYLKKEFEINVLSSNKNINELLGNKEFFDKELDRDNIYKLIHPYIDEKFAIHKEV